MNERDTATLIEELDCDDIIKCQTARRSLVKIGHAAVPSLVKALGSQKRWVRWESAKALSQIGDAAATGALIDALEDRDFDVRWLAAEGLIAIGKKAVVSLLRVLAKKGKSVWLREGVHHVLHDLDRGDWDGDLRPVMTALEAVEPSAELLVVVEKALEALENRTPGAGG